MTDDKVKARDWAEFTIGVETHPEYVYAELIHHTKPLQEGETYELIEKEAYLAIQSELEAKKTELSEVHKYINSCKKLLPKKDSEILAVICHDAANQISELTKERDGLRAALIQADNLYADDKKRSLVIHEALYGKAGK